MLTCILEFMNASYSAINKNVEMMLWLGTKEYVSEWG